MASQRFKDDGSGRMVASFISDRFDALWVDENDMKKVNANRARQNKLPISFGFICPLEGGNLHPDYSTHLDLELSTLNAERVSMIEARGLLIQIGARRRFGLITGRTAKDTGKPRM
jgi:hypothetical protein